MSKTTKIVIAIVGGALVGAIGVCGIVWPTYGQLCALGAGLVTVAVATITGIAITKE